MGRINRLVTGLVLSTCATATSLAAQGGFGKVEGHVMTGAKTPIARAVVMIVGTALRGQTNAQGYYLIDSIPAGVVQVRAANIGYKPHEVAGLRVPSGQTITGLDFTLEPSQITLREITPASSLTSMLLRFQLIRPTATRTTDKSLMPIDSALRDLFQWPGYQLLAQSALTLDLPIRVEWGGNGASSSTQTMLNVDGHSYDLSVRADTGDFLPQRIKLSVSLVGLSHAAATSSAMTSSADRKTLLSTTVTVNFGRTVVLGTTQPGGGRGGMSGTLILTVSPVIVRPPN